MKKIITLVFALPLLSYVPARAGLNSLNNGPNSFGFQTPLSLDKLQPAQGDYSLNGHNIQGMPGQYSALMFGATGTGCGVSNGQPLHDDGPAINACIQLNTGNLGSGCYLPSGYINPQFA
jgi:hypothetical protein